MKKVIIVLWFALLPVWAKARELIVPDQFAQVSEAIVAAVSGDTILVRPGQYTDTSYWNLWATQSPIRIIGLGNSPSDVRYLIPSESAGSSDVIILNSGCTLENIQVGTQEEYTELIAVSWKAQNVTIRNVVCAPITRTAISFRSETSGEISHVTIVGGTSKQYFGIGVGANSSVRVHHCIVQDLLMGIGGPSDMEKYRNLFWNVFHLPATPDPTDIINLADPMLDPVTFVPGYGSLAVDTGDPNYLDPDGTIVDRGAVYRSQILYTLEFLSDPRDEVKVELPESRPEKIFRAGDRFVLASRLLKTKNPPNLVSHPTLAYLALECYGSFWWAPEWTTEVDSRNIALADGYDQQEIIFDFIWPVVAGSATGLRFWATTITQEGWVGPLACLQFGYE